LLIIGTGEKIEYFDQEFISHFKKLNIAIETLDSRNAISTFNILNMEDRRVAAAILPKSFKNSDNQKNLNRSYYQRDIK